MEDDNVQNPSRRKFLKLGAYSTVGAAAILGVGSLLNANDPTG